MTNAPHLTRRQAKLNGEAKVLKAPERGAIWKRARITEGVMPWQQPASLSVDINRAPAARLQQVLGLSKKEAMAIVGERRAGLFFTPADLERVRGLTPAVIRRVRHRVVTQYRDQPHITALRVAGGKPARPGEPFALDLRFIGPSDGRVVAAEILTGSGKKSHSLRFEISKAHAAAGQLRLLLPKKVALAAGAAQLQVLLYDNRCRVARSMLSMFVFPPIVSMVLKPVLLQGAWPLVDHELQVIGSASSQTASQTASFEISCDVVNLAGTDATYAQHTWRMLADGVVIHSETSSAPIKVTALSTFQFIDSFTFDQTSPVLQALNQGKQVTVELELSGASPTWLPSPLTDSLNVRTAHHHFVLNVFSSDTLSADDRVRLGAAVDHASHIFLALQTRCAGFNLNYFVHDKSIFSHSFVGTVEEAKDLFSSFEGPKPGPDVFLVLDAFLAMSQGALLEEVRGFAVTEVNCTKKEDEGILLVVQYDGTSEIDPWETGQTLAHEIGHWVGLEHPKPSVSGALMNATFTLNEDEFLTGDDSIVHNHCAIHGGPGVV